jgi:hypothetical protein
MLFIMAMIAQERIPVDTIAPKFSGRFNKGVDYVGNTAQFEKEFEQDVAVLRFAAEQFGLKKTLRLSVHSGSDKFAIYPAMNRVIKKYGAGLHVKTAGTTWLEEVIGLAESGGDGRAHVSSVTHGNRGTICPTVRCAEGLRAPEKPHRLRGTRIVRSS